MALARRHQSEHAHLPLIRVENSGQDLQRRRLPGAVGADERDPFSGGNPEREPVDGGGIPRLWSEEVVKARSDSSGPWAAHAKGFREPLKLDGRFWVHRDAPLCRPAEAPENPKRPSGPSGTSGRAWVGC